VKRWKEGRGGDRARGNRREYLEKQRQASGDLVGVFDRQLEFLDAYGFRDAGEGVERSVQAHDAAQGDQSAGGTGDERASVRFQAPTNADCFGGGENDREQSEPPDMGIPECTRPEARRDLFEDDTTDIPDENGQEMVEALQIRDVDIFRSEEGRRQRNALHRERCNGRGTLLREQGGELRAGGLDAEAEPEKEDVLEGVADGVHPGEEEHDAEGDDERRRYHRHLKMGDLRKS